MSVRDLKYQTLYNTLKESIDFDKAQSFPLTVNRDVRFKVEGLDVGVKIERFENGGESMFPPNSILYKNFNPKTYYNIGFDIEDSTTQQYKTNYKTLAKILGIVVKSTIDWIEQNQPKVVTIIPTGKDEKESNKKLNIYASVLQGNNTLLNSIGYYWDQTRFNNNPGLFISKI